MSIICLKSLVSSRLDRQQGDDDEVVVKRLVEKGNLLIQKGNAALWNNRVPDDPANPHIFL